MRDRTSILERVYAIILGAIYDLNKMMKLALRYARARIEFPFEVSSMDNVHIGRNVVIAKGARFNVGKKCHLYIGDGTWIGRYSQFGGTDYSLRIGKNVLIAERVYMSTCRHGYEDVTKPITEQGLVPKGDVRIEDDCWIGTGVCILPNVTIGKHSVIGANAVVIHDIPPYSVAVGNPARVVKKYDFERKQWVPVGSNTYKT